MYDGVDTARVFLPDPVGGVYCPMAIPVNCSPAAGSHMQLQALPKVWLFYMTKQAAPESLHTVHCLVLITPVRFLVFDSLPVNEGLPAKPAQCTRLEARMIKSH